MPYDLYGTYYASARDAENAEMAQCAAIDADLAYRNSQKLEQKYIDAQLREYEMCQKIDYLMDKVEDLEKRISELASR
jgi:hypothetical protein